MVAFVVVVMVMDILIDCDGVLSNFTGHLFRYLGSHLVPDDVMDWDVFKLVEAAHGRPAVVRAHEFLARAQFWRTMPPLVDAVAFMSKLRARSDVEVFVVTSPWPACETWAFARTAWLAENFGIDRDHVIIAANKRAIAGDVFVDDKPEHVNAWTESHQGTAVLFAQPYNQKAALHPRAVRGDWTTVLDSIDHVAPKLPPLGLLHEVLRDTFDGAEYRVVLHPERLSRGRQLGAEVLRVTIEHAPGDAERAHAAVDRLVECGIVDPTKQLLVCEPR